MDASRPDAELRTVIADGLDRLNQSQGGRYLSTVARRLMVDRSTVSRWRQHQSTARPDHCEDLARHWPAFFDLDQLLDLHYRSLRLDQASIRRTAGVDIFYDTADLLRAATEEILADPGSPTDRTIRHCALHLEDIGTDPLTTDDQFRGAPAEQLVLLRNAISGRAREGWSVKTVVSSGNPRRMARIKTMIHAIDGPDVEIFAYPFRLPLVMAPLVISNQTVLLAYDHRRWELPGAAMLIRSRAAATWANHYFDELIADAHFRLRRPSGIDHDELDRFARAVEQSNGYLDPAMPPPTTTSST